MLRRPLTPEEEARKRRYHAEWCSKNKDRVSGYTRAGREKNPEVYRERELRYILENPEKVKETKANYRKRNRDKINEYEAMRRERERDQINARAREWRQNNKPKVRHWYKMRELSERRATPPWLTIEHRREILAVYELAERLTRETGVTHHVDHIFPIKGKNCSGLHVPWNLRAIPAKENLRKSNKVLEQPTLRIGA
jgi:hypothetical protein